MGPVLSSVFYILIAGCGHDAGVCTPISMEAVNVRAAPECEAILDARLMADTSGWPVLQGSCVTGAQVLGLRQQLTRSARRAIAPIHQSL